MGKTFSEPDITRLVAVTLATSEILEHSSLDGIDAGYVQFGEIIEGELDFLG